MSFGSGSRLTPHLCYCRPSVRAIRLGLLFGLLFGGLFPSPVSAQQPGTITTVAGSGTEAISNDIRIIKPGYSGDGGPATQARLHSPMSVAFDVDGNLYVADSYNNSVRKVDRDGIITAFAGTKGPHENESDYTYGSFGGDGGPALQARLSLTLGVTADLQGNLYIADWGNHRIRKVSPDGTITTVAGVGPNVSPTTGMRDGKCHAL